MRNVKPRLLIAFATTCTLLMVCDRSPAQIVCEPGWADEFAAPETAPAPAAMVEFDFGDGAGPVLVAGGTGLKVWDGMSWAAKGSFTGGEVWALAVFDDGRGDGPILVAGGTFQLVNNVLKPRLVKWDSATESWQTFGGVPNAGVHALAVWDDGSGSGPALYAGGAFTTIAGQSADRLAKWDGTAWTEVGDGVQGGSVWSLMVHDDAAGRGPALFVGGEFTTAGALTVNRIAKWSGPSAGWSALGSGIELHFSTNPAVVITMCSFDEGNGAGEELFVGGLFNHAGGEVAFCLAKWNGATQTWSSVGGGTDNTVDALLGWNGSLYVGGRFDTVGGLFFPRVARWTPPSDARPAGGWSRLGLGVHSASITVRSFCIHQPQLGVLNDAPMLYVGGHFACIYGAVPPGVTGLFLGFGAWDGTQWRFLGHGLNGTALALASCGEGSVVYAGGDFSQASGLPVSRLVKSNGSEWSPVGDAEFNSGSIQTLLVESGADGCELYVGGGFNGVNGNGSPGVARFDGTTWSALGAGLGGGSVRDLVFFDDDAPSGRGQTLYACGSFTSTGGVRVARWDGASWHAVGSTAGIAYDLEIFDDGQGGGPALHVCGGNFVRRWNGTTWDSLGTFDDLVRKLVVFDDGSGTALYAGGDFSMVDGGPVAKLAKWNGTSWEQVGGGFDGPSDPFITSLVVWNDPPGVRAKSALLVGGEFTSAGGVPADYIALWDGKGWSSLNSGMDRRVWEVHVADHPDGSVLFVGGWFNYAGGLAADGIARLSCLGQMPSPGDVNGDGAVDVDDLIAVILAWGPCADCKQCPADVNDDCAVDVDDLITVILSWA